MTINEVCINVLKERFLAEVTRFIRSLAAARLILSKDIGKRIAVVLGPCELRALIELEKLSQCTLDPAILISMDCFGRMENDRYLELAATQDDPESAFYVIPDFAGPIFQ